MPPSVSPIDTKLGRPVYHSRMHKEVSKTYAWNWTGNRPFWFQQLFRVNFGALIQYLDLLLLIHQTEHRSRQVFLADGRYEMVMLFFFLACAGCRGKPPKNLFMIFDRKTDGHFGLKQPFEGELYTVNWPAMTTTAQNVGQTWLINSCLQFHFIWKEI